MSTSTPRMEPIRRLPGGCDRRPLPGSASLGVLLVAHATTLARTEPVGPPPYCVPHGRARSPRHRRRSARVDQGRTRIGTPVDGEHVLGLALAQQAGDFRTCPLMYRLRTIDRLPEAPSPDALRGTVVHKVLEDLFDLAAADRTPDRADAMVQGAWEFVLDAEPEAASLFTGEGAGDHGLAGLVPREPAGLLRARGPEGARAGGA